MATIFAWSGAFKKRGELDGLPELVKFGEALEAASLQTLKTTKASMWDGTVFVYKVRHDFVGNKSTIYFRDLLEGY